jgi:hypothetical protein
MSCGRIVYQRPSPRIVYQRPTSAPRIRIIFSQNFRSEQKYFGCYAVTLLLVNKTVSGFFDIFRWRCFTQRRRYRLKWRVLHPERIKRVVLHLVTGIPNSVYHLRRVVQMSGVISRSMNTYSLGNIRAIRTLATRTCAIRTPIVFVGSVAMDFAPKLARIG